MLKAMVGKFENTELSTRDFALEGLMRVADSCTTLGVDMRERLQAAYSPVAHNSDLLPAFRDYLKKPAATDRALLAAARYFRLTLIETLAVQIAVLAEEDLLVGHLLTHLQQPMAGSRPTIGVLARAFADDDAASAVHVLGQGAAVRCGMLQLCGDDLPLPEREVRVLLPNSLAMRQMKTSWPGTELIAESSQIPLGAVAEQRAAALGKRLCEVTPAPILLLRGGDVLETRAAARMVCSASGTQGVLLPRDQIPGIAPWLFLNRLIPVFSQRLAPGENSHCPAIPSFAGPMIVLTGPEGDFEAEGRPILHWRLEIPVPSEREALWSRAIGDDTLAHRMATDHRHTAARISALSARVKDSLGPGESITYERICATARMGDSIGIGALAELIHDEVHDDALVISEKLRQELESLVVRCRLREQFGDSLGPSIKARYRPSSRALFVGPSGTGKTLAAVWLATRLSMPLYRVDLSAITSKYIGETEKNLSQLFMRAEQNEVVLLFDEADALFGKRTEIHEANDRFANAQTNYLLQRMETYDGITVLTSNGRNHFDSAFSRRFDAILEFPGPGPEQRRALWSAHLGRAHEVEAAHLDLVAAAADLSGGQIRNAVLRSAVAAAQENKAISYRHLLIGVAGEYRKLSRQLPNELKQTNVPVVA